MMSTVLFLTPGAKKGARRAPSPDTKLSTLGRSYPGTRVQMMITPQIVVPSFVLYWGGTVEAPE